MHIRRRVAVLRNPPRAASVRSASAAKLAAHGTLGIRRAATGLGLAPAPLVVAPGAFAAFRAAMLRRPDTASSPRGALRRASAEPLLRVSLSSALDPSRPLLTYLL